jgi:hypothetical protein
VATEQDRYITLHLRVHWKTPEGMDNDEDSWAVYQAVMERTERCLATNICGQVGVIPGTEKMELLHGTVI